MIRTINKIKKYGWLILASGLPIAVAALALGFNHLSQYFVDLPRYNFLYALMPKYDNPIRYYVINGELRVALEKNFDLKKLDEGSFPRLYLFDVKSRKSQALTLNAVDLIQKIRQTKRFEQKIPLEEASQFCSGRQARDKYRIISFDNAYMVNSKAIIFNLVKSGYIIKVPYPDNNVDLGHRAVFVGWVER